MGNLVDKKDNWDAIFRFELMKVFNTTKQLVEDNKSDEELVNYFKILADDFYNTFQSSPIPVKKAIPELDINNNPLLYSATITLSFSCFMVPYFFYSVLKENQHFNLDEEFAQNLPWDKLLGIINQRWLKQRKGLTKTDVMICKVLARYNVKGQKYVFPITTEILSNRTRQSHSGIKLTYPTLFIRGIINDFFLINHWKIGWELYIVCYNKTEDTKFSAFDQLTLSKELMLGAKTFRVIQQPRMTSYNEHTELKKFCKSISAEIFLLDQIIYHWDLNQLQPRVEKSFLDPPNFISGPIKPIEPNIVFHYENTSLQWFSEVGEITRPGRKKPTKQKHSLFGPIKNSELNKARIMQILNYILEKGFTLRSLEITAKRLDIPILEFNKLLHYIIQSDIIALAHRFLFIGAGSEYSFIIQNGSEELFELVTQSLMQCPFSYFYQSKTILAGRCQVPNNWIDKFFEYFMRFQEDYPQIELQFGPRVLGYSYFIPNIKLPKDYVLIEFGMDKIPEFDISR